MPSSITTFMLALVVTGVEIPKQDALEEEQDDLREEAHEAALVEEEAASESRSSVAALEATIREQVEAIAATHKEMEAIRSQMTAGFSFVVPPSMVGPEGNQGCVMFTLDAVLGTEPLQIKLWNRHVTNQDTQMGGGMNPIATYVIKDPKNNELYSIFGPDAKYGEGGCRAEPTTVIPSVHLFFETKVAVPWQFGDFDDGCMRDASAAHYCLSVHKPDKDEADGFKQGAWSWMSDSIKCFNIGCEPAGMRCNSNLGEGDNFLEAVNTVVGAGMNERMNPILKKNKDCK